MSIDNIPDTEPRVQYVASASQTTFAYPFPIFDDDDLIVYVGETLKTISTDYTVTGVTDDNGGNVVFTSGRSAGEIVTIWRDTTISRTVDYQQNGPITSTAINDDFDRLTVITQEQKNALARSIRFPRTAAIPDSGLELTPFNNWLSRYLFVDSNGALTPAVSVTGVTLTQAVVGQVLYPQTALEASAGVTPTAYNFEPYDVRRYGALGDNSNNDAVPAASAATIASRYTRFANGLTFKFVPNSVSPYTFGNAPTVNVYGAVHITGSDYMVDGEGSKLHITSRAGVAGSDLQYCYITDKNLVMGAQSNIVFNGTSIDTENNADAANSNHRGMYLTGVDVVRFLNTRGFSSGNRRGNQANLQNCKNVQILGHLHRKNTQAINFRYCLNMLVVGGIWDDFSECLDFDGTQQRALVLGNCFESTNRTCQVFDINGQVDGVFSGFTAFTVGQIANISHKSTTPETFADYVNEVAAVVKTPSQRIILNNFTAKAVGGSTSVAIVIGNDWAEGGHAGYEGPHDIIIGPGFIEDTGYMMVWECERLTIRDLYMGGVLTAAGTYAVNVLGLVSTGDQRSWAPLTALIDGLTINGSDRGGLRLSNSKTVNIRNVKVRNVNTSGSTDFAVQLTNLIERGAQLTVDGLDCDGSGNVNINGNSASIAAWAPNTLYRRSQIVSNGGRYYRATSDSGTSAGAGGPTGIAASITDGTVTWEYLSEPFSVYWGLNNRLHAGCTIVFTGDAHKYTHGRKQSCVLGDLAATGTRIFPLFVADRKCYVSFAKGVVGATVAADAVNFRTIQIKSLTNLGVTTTTISSFSTAGGLTAFVPFDLGFQVIEAGAYLEPGDVLYAEIPSTAAGMALTGLMIQPNILDC